MKTCIYLRKSRQDEELDKKENTDTLARHRSTLLNVAKQQNLDIVEIKEEIVSGGSVSSRPKMLQLLDEVKNNTYDAVLCIDLDRLGRGGMQDQGLILDTFKESRTLIITPDKTYDLNNELDEEMTEFKSFFARRELKMITKRMVRGREKSVEEGNYIASSAPYGYKFVYNEEGKRQLAIDEEKAAIVRNIFDMYLNGNGAYKIKVYLDSAGIKTNTNKPFSEMAIRRILKNKVYAGYVTWNNYRRRGTKTIKQNGDNLIVAKGKHKALVTEDIWNRVNEIINSRSTAPVGDNKKLVNPLAGLVKCACCGHNMLNSYSTYKDEGYIKIIRCKSCNKNRGSKLEVLEEEILNNLNSILYEFKESILNKEIESKESTRINNLSHTLKLLEKEQEELNKQKNNLHDLLERGIYDVDTYLERTSILNTKSEQNKEAIENTIKLIDNEKSLNINYRDLATNIERVLNNYYKTEDIIFKNNLLKSLIDEIIYFKEKGRKSKFEIEIKFKF